MKKIAFALALIFIAGSASTATTTLLDIETTTTELAGTFPFAAFLFIAVSSMVLISAFKSGKCPDRTKFYSQQDQELS